MLRGAGDFASPPEGESRHWIEHMRVPSLSVGTYSIPAGGSDGQQPHTEDEVYVVMAGRGRIVADDSGEAEVAPGSVIYVPAREAHRFVDITEDLTVVVVFAPAEHSGDTA